MELSNVIATTLGVDLPSTLVFDYPSISALAEHVHRLLDDLNYAEVAYIHDINPMPLPTAAFERRSMKVCLTRSVLIVFVSHHLELDARQIAIQCYIFTNTYQSEYMHLLVGQSQ